MLLTLKEVADRTLAEKFRGLEVFAEEAEVDSAEAESEAVVGCEVFDRGKLIGKVEDIEHTACHEVLVVKTVSKKEILIPYIDKFIKEVNNDTLKVDLADIGEDDEV